MRIENTDSSHILKDDLVKWKEYSSLVQYNTERELKNKDILMYKIHFEKLAFKDKVK